MGSNEFKYFFKPYFEKLVSELHRISKSLSHTIFEEFEKLEERDLQYRDGAFGITELLQCPLKAKFRRQVEDKIEVRSNEITDGYIFEHFVKLILTKLLGRDKVIPEKTLPYDFKIDEDNMCKIDGHLDVFVDLRKDHNTVVGLELKSTVVQYDNKLFDRPPEILFLEPEEIHRININHKYILQVKIQRYILEKLYPDTYIETYLFIKTQLKTRYKIGKTYIVLPIVESISDDHLRKICHEFLFNPKPRFPYECNHCIYKEHGFCEGIPIQDSNPVFKLDNKQKARELLDEYVRLLKQLKHIEDQLKYLISTPMKYNDQWVGWLEVDEYDLNQIAQILLLKKKNLNSFFELKPGALRRLKKITDLNNIQKNKKKRFVLPELKDKDEYYCESDE
jgi:hypothetical protein